jgi:hypothetical protein
MQYILSVLLALLFLTALLLCIEIQGNNNQSDSLLVVTPTLLQLNFLKILFKKYVKHIKHPSKNNLTEVLNYYFKKSK